MKHIQTNRFAALRSMPARLAVAALSSSPGLLWAQAGYGGADKKVEGFLSNITGLLNLASIAVVTIAIIFAGYQIAFAHKRISDVAPILIGGLLIGAAAQIATMLIGTDAGAASAMVLNTLSHHA